MVMGYSEASLTLRFPDGIIFLEGNLDILSFIRILIEDENLFTSEECECSNYSYNFPSSIYAYAYYDIFDQLCS